MSVLLSWNCCQIISRHKMAIDHQLFTVVMLKHVENLMVHFQFKAAPFLEFQRFWCKISPTNVKKKCSYTLDFCLSVPADQARANCIISNSPTILRKVLWIGSLFLKWTHSPQSKIRPWFEQNIRTVHCWFCCCQISVNRLGVDVSNYRKTTDTNRSPIYCHCIAKISRFSTIKNANQSIQIGSKSNVFQALEPPANKIPMCFSQAC